MGTFRKDGRTAVSPVRGHRASRSHRARPRAQGVPHQALHQERDAGALPFLVLHSPPGEDEEGQRRDPLHPRDLREKPDKVSKYGIWLRYDSRSGTTNMYKEFSACTQNEAVAQMYQEMAGRHHPRFRSIHIIQVQELEGDLKEKCLRPQIKQFLDANIKFPLTHRQPRNSLKGRRKGTMASAPTTFKN